MTPSWAHLRGGTEAAPILSLRQRSNPIPDKAINTAHENALNTAIEAYADGANHELGIEAACRAYIKQLAASAHEDMGMDATV
jgi:hypothetical protein